MKAIIPILLLMFFLAGCDQLSDFNLKVVPKICSPFFDKSYKVCKKYNDDLSEKPCQDAVAKAGGECNELIKKEYGIHNWLNSSDMKVEGDFKDAKKNTGDPE